MNKTDKSLVKELSQLLRWFICALNKRDESINEEQIDAHLTAMNSMLDDMWLLLKILNKDNNEETKDLEANTKNKKKAG